MRSSRVAWSRARFRDRQQQQRPASRSPCPRRRPRLVRCTTSHTFAETARSSWRRVGAGTFLPGNGAPGELCVAVLRRYRIDYHDPDTIPLPTFRAATADLLPASRGSASEHRHEEHANAYHPTHRHSDLPSFGARSLGRKEGPGDSSRVPHVLHTVASTRTFTE